MHDLFICLHDLNRAFCPRPRTQSFPLNLGGPECQIVLTPLHDRHSYVELFWIRGGWRATRCLKTVTFDSLNLWSFGKREEAEREECLPHKAPYRSLNNREMMSGREKKTAVAKFSSCPSVAAGDQSQGERGEVGSPSPLLRSCSAAISTTVHTFRPPGLKCALLTPGLPNPSCLLLVSKNV